LHISAKTPDMQSFCCAFGGMVDQPKGSQAERAFYSNLRRIAIESADSEAIFSDFGAISR